MIITVTLNPALDKMVILPGFAVNTVNRVQSIRLDPGGKGINVSKSVQALGGKTLAITALGGGSGGYIKAALDALGLPNDPVITDQVTRTNLKIVDPVLGTNTDINEPGKPLSQQALDSIWEKLSRAVQPGDTVVFAGKNPPEMADDLLRGRREKAANVRDEVLHTVACKAAIKAGWRNDEAELLAVAKAVMERDDLKHCPHGRPVCITLSKKSLERQFKRS